MSSWTPNTFRAEGKRRGYNADYLEALVAEGTRLSALGVPVVFTLGHLAAICCVPYVFLNDIVRRASDPYRVFRVKKRRGGFRQITVPNPELLRVQRWIHQNILSTRAIHPTSTAFAKGCEPKKNAALHSSARWLVKLDLANFFEAISERQVYCVFRTIGYPALLSFQFARICTRLAAGSRKYRKRRWKTQGHQRYSLFASEHLGHLPQGAPSSPMLANLVCTTIDSRLAQISRRYNCTYSRYADDITFSAESLTRSQVASLIEQTSQQLGHHGLTRNRQKTQVAPPGARRMVTGLLVDGSEPRLPREFRDNLRLHLYHARTKGIYEHCLRRKFRSLLGFRAHLDGIITYAEHVDTSFGAKCRAAYNSLPWGDLAEF